MQKFRNILRHSLVAKFFVHLFIFNFFTCQCFAMLPSEVVVGKVHENVRALFDTFDDLHDSIGIELKHKEQSDEFDLEITRTSYLGESSTEKLSSVSFFDSEREREFVDFGYGLSFSIIDGSIHLSPSFCNYSGYFKTEANLVISELRAVNGFSISAKAITIQNSLSSDFNLTLLASSILNQGTVTCPLLDIRANEITNEGRISGQTVSIETERLESRNKASISGSTMLNIKAQDEIIIDSSSITGNRLQISSPRVDLRNGSYLKSGSTFDFSGKEFCVSSSTLETKDRAHFMVSHFRNDNSGIFAETGITVFSNIFFNSGSLISKNVNINACLRQLSFGPLSRSMLIEEYDFPRLDKRFGCVANSGTIKADTLTLVAEKHLLNKGILSSAHKIYLSSVKELVNEGHIQQTEYSPTIASEISSQSGIINKKGVIDFRSGLLIHGESLDNTEGKLKARQLRIFLALDEAGAFQENEKEFLAAQTESNPHSEAFQEYMKVTRGVSKAQAPDHEEQQQNSDESPESEKKKAITPEIGFLINTGGTIESGRDLEIKGSGAIYNAERGTISAKDKITIEIFGRLLNQLGSKISASSATIKSAGKVFNTGGSSMLGSFIFESNGFENGVGSTIKGGIHLKSVTSILNFGELITLGSPFALSSNFTVKNYGSMISDTPIEIEARQELSNEGGKIIAPIVNAKKTMRVFNKGGGLIEAKTGDVVFADGVTLLNEGRIASNNLKLIKLIPAMGAREINQDGVMDIRHSLFISTIYPLTHIKGIINAPEFVFENRAGGTIDFSLLLKDSAIRTQKAEFHFPNARVENKTDTKLGFGTQIFAKEFYNFALLHGISALLIKTDSIMVNGLRHLFEEPTFEMNSDFDVSNNTQLAFLNSVVIDLAPNRVLEKTVISAAGDLSLESDTEIKNTGTIKTSGHLHLKGKQVQHGWAYESVRHESLPELEFDYDYMESQPSFMVAERGATFEVDKFLNTLGTIDISGGLTSTNAQCFLNYGGTINVHGGASVTTPVFANLIGTIKTNRADQRYWSLEFCNTDSAVFNVLGGKLDIGSQYVVNSGSHLYAGNGVFINGVKSDDSMGSVVDISGAGIGYTRMFSVNEYNRGQYADRILGMGLASTGNGAIIRAELNETVKKKILPASVSSSKQVVIEGYKDLRSNGIIHGTAVEIKTGDGTTELGYIGDAILPSVSGFAKTVELFPYVSSLAENKNFDVADSSSDFFFKSAESKTKMPFTIIDDGSVDLTNLKLPFSPEVIEVMMMKRMQTALGTGYLPDMPSLLDAAKISAAVPAARKVDAAAFCHLNGYTSDQISLVSPTDAQHGLFFRPQKIGNYTLLFPELHLSSESVHSALLNPSGATVAQGKENANVIIDTEGFLHATASLHADDIIGIQAKRGALFETTTYDAMGITQNMTATTSRGFLGTGIGASTKYHKLTEWHQVKKAREPMLATTTRGDFIIILPDDKESAEFKGMFADIAGNFEVYGGNCVLSPLEVAEVVPCPKLFGGLFGESANRISTMLPVFLQTVLKSNGDLLADVRVFKNTAGKIKALGDVVVKASDRIEFNTATKKFTLAEGTSVDSGIFTTKTSSRKVEDVMFAQPEVDVGGNVKFETDSATLSGKFKSARDIEINARIAELKSELAYGTDEFSSKASNWFASSSCNRFATFARVAPTIFESHGDFIADITEAYFEHSIQKTCRDERIKAASIDSSPLRAHETVIETRSSRGFNVFIPTSVMSPLCDGHIHEAIDAFWRESSLLSAVNSFIHSRRGADIAASGISTALAAYNSVKTVLDHGIGGAASLFGIGNFGFYNTHLRSVTDHDFTIPSVTVAARNIDWHATSGDIRITHRLAQAGGGQRYTSAGRIDVRPGEDSTRTSQRLTSVNGSFNIFTGEVGVGWNRSDLQEEVTEYQPSSFVSQGENVFSAGNGIHIVIPQIEGRRNTFDAVVVKLENKANKRRTSSRSTGVTISTNPAQAGVTLSGSFGIGSGYDTHLNDAYVRGAVDFMHSRVKNQGCLVMNIENAGASYEYMPMGEVHKSRNFAIGLSGLDLRSADAFAYSLGRDLTSSAASMGAGMLASEAGMGGFVSTLAASLAGTYVNTEVLPQRPSDGSRPTGLGSTGSVSYDRNGDGFQAVNVEFDRAEFNAVVNQIKANIFAEALDEDLSTEETVERIEVAGEYINEVLSSEEEELSIAIVKEKAQALSKTTQKIHKKLKSEISQASLSTEITGADLVFERFLGTNAGLEQENESEAYQFLIRKGLSEVSADPHNESKLRKLRVTIESYACEYPQLAKAFGQALEMIGATADFSGGYALTAGILAGTGITIAEAPAIATAVTFGATTYLVHKAGESLGEAINYAAVKIAEWQTLDSQERTELSADYSLAGLIGLASIVKVKAAGATVKNVIPLNKIKPIIKEIEMVQKAVALPGEWKGQFKLIREVPYTATGTDLASTVYSREVLFKDPKSGQMFRVFQRNDIDPNYVVREGLRELTNLERMNLGKAPYTTSGEKVIIHHMGQDIFGPFVEVTKTSHKPALHNQFGYGKKHPTNPVDRSEFNPIRGAYWRAYAKQFK